MFKQSLPRSPSSFSMLTFANQHWMQSTPEVEGNLFNEPKHWTKEQFDLMKSHVIIKVIRIRPILPVGNLNAWTKTIHPTVFETSQFGPNWWSNWPWQTDCKPWVGFTSVPVYFLLSTEFNYLLVSSISFFPTKHCSMTLSSFSPSFPAGPSNRICLIVFYSLIHISATPSQPGSKLMSLWKRIMSFQQSLHCVFSGQGRTACGGGVSAESQYQQG